MRGPGPPLPIYEFEVHARPPEGEQSAQRPSRYTSLEVRTEVWTRHTQLCVDGIPDRTLGRITEGSEYRLRRTRRSEPWGVCTLGGLAWRRSNQEPEKTSELGENPAECSVLGPREESAAY